MVSTSQVRFVLFSASAADRFNKIENKTYSGQWAVAVAVVGCVCVCAVCAQCVCSVCSVCCAV